MKDFNPEIKQENIHEQICDICEKEKAVVVCFPCLSALCRKCYENHKHNELKEY
jgi:hypothetical protein